MGKIRHMRQLAFLSLALVACGGAEIQPPVTPKNASDHIREGDLGSALETCRRGDCTDDQKTQVAKMIVLQKKPQLDLHVLSDDEVFARYGGRTTRHLLWQHFAIDIKATTPGFDHAKISIQPEGDHGKLSSVIRDPEHFTALTSEHYPAPHEWQEWAVMHVPYPTVDGLGSLALAAAEVMIIGPLQLLTLHRETRTRAPTDEEVRAAVPLAVKLLETSKQTFFVARPLAEEPLVLHSAVALDVGASTIGAHLDLPLVGNKDTHVDLAGANEVALSAFPDERCDPPCKTAPLGPPRFMTIGLTVPDVPKDLGTPDASDKAKPYWTSDMYAPERVFDGPVATKNEEARLVVCKMKTIEVPGEDADDVYANVTFGKRTFKRNPMSFTSFPLVRIAPGGTWSVSLWDVDWLSGDDWLSTVSLRRSGANVVRVVSPKYAEIDLACTVHSRPAIEAELMSRWLSANDEIETMDRIVRVDLGKAEFGLERRKVATEAIEGMAALVGWDDPRVKPLVEKIAAQEKTFGIATKTALETWSKEHPSTDLKVNGIRCGKDAMLNALDHPEYKHTKCVVDVEIAAGATLKNIRVINVRRSIGRSASICPTAIER